MKTLDELTQAMSALQETCVILNRKLDDLGLSQGSVNTNLCSVAEGQDKLIQSHAALAKQLEELGTKLDAKIMATGNGLGDELGYIRLGIANLFAKVCQAQTHKNRASRKPRTRRGG
jgi:hypothetical protein